MALQEIVDDVLAARRPARAIIGEALDRVAALNDDLHALVAIDAGDAERQADEVDRRVAAGERPALAGVVVGIKDNIWVAGRRVTQGSRLFAGFTAPADAIAVGRLRQAGAVILGSTNTPEFAAKGVTTNLLFGPTRHPRDGSLTP
ncbi:MAG: amidase family protein, partial [Azospirillaceae bacterium]